MSSDLLPIHPAAPDPGPADHGEGRCDHPAAGRPASQAATVAPLLIDRRELARLLSVGVATLDRMRAAGRIPPPLTLSPGCVRWRLDEVRAWLDAGAPTAKEWEARKAAVNGRK